MALHRRPPSRGEYVSLEPCQTGGKRAPGHAGPVSGSRPLRPGGSPLPGAARLGRRRARKAPAAGPRGPGPVEQGPQVREKGSGLHGGRDRGDSEGKATAPGGGRRMTRLTAWAFGLREPDKDFLGPGTFLIESTIVRRGSGPFSGEVSGLVSGTSQHVVV